MMPILDDSHVRETTVLQTKSPPNEARERLIIALDVDSKKDALQLVDELDGLVSFYKIGYQLFLAEGMGFVDELIHRGIHVFLDLKLDDVEETITNAAREITRHNVNLLTIHGNGATARAARAGRGDSIIPKILSVTLLSSLDAQDLTDLGVLGKGKKFLSLTDYVLWRAEAAIAAGCDGLIASGETIAQIRSKVGSDPIIVSPGIRPDGTAKDDHKRSATPRDAIVAGADYLVVGRPVRNARNRRQMAESIIAEIDEALAVVT
jgi:orotidine-5'-phosphate decarboxylase